MTDKIVSTTVEILGKPYPIRCPENEVASLQQAADYLHQKMSEIQESGKVSSLERVAIITALNITYQFLQTSQQKISFAEKINQRISHMQEKIETAMSQSLQTEFVYSAE